MRSIVAATDQARSTVSVVAEGALIGRINRKLKPSWQRVRKTRNSRVQRDLGLYYLLDVYSNVIVETHVDLEELGPPVRGTSAVGEIAPVWRMIHSR